MKRLRRPWTMRAAGRAGALVLAALLGHTLVGCEATRDFPDIAQTDVPSGDTGLDSASSDAAAGTDAATATDTATGNDTAAATDTTAGSDATLPEDATASDTADAGAADAQADTAEADTAESDTADTAPDALAANQPGAPFPLWQLQDKQPQSAKFGQTYGLAAFAGKATLVSLLSSS